MMDAFYTCTNPLHQKKMSQRAGSENVHTPPEEFPVGRVSVRPKNIKRCMLMDFLRGVGVGKVWIFSGTTQYQAVPIQFNSILFPLDVVT